MRLGFNSVIEHQFNKELLHLFRRRYTKVIQGIEMTMSYVSQGFRRPRRLGGEKRFSYVELRNYGEVRAKQRSD